MGRRWWMGAMVLAVGLAVLATAGPGASQDKDKKEDPFAAMMKFAAPGPEHKNLEPLNGSWTFTAKMWMEPGKPPTDSKGTAERKWMLDGRFLVEDIKGDFLGKPFTGYGITGYDRAQKKYVGAWMDNFSTGISSSTGTYDESKKTFTFTREEVDPSSGAKHKVRDTLRLDSNDRHTMEMFRGGPDGKEMKVMEIVMTRRK